jgi:hypothetical protein
MTDPGASDCQISKAVQGEEHTSQWTLMYGSKLELLSCLLITDIHSTRKCKKSDNKFQQWAQIKNLECNDGSKTVTRFMIFSDRVGLLAVTNCRPTCDVLSEVC